MTLYIQEQAKQMIIQAKNILDIPFGVIGHQVNCRGVMGSGVAKSIREMYPPVFKAYNQMCEMTPEIRRFQLLGQVQFVTASELEGKPLIFANIFSQLSTSTGSRETEYGSLYRGLRTIEEKMRGLRLPVYFPYLIGCGAGGGDWNIVQEMLHAVFDPSDIRVYICAHNPNAETFAFDIVYPAVKKSFSSKEEFKEWLYTQNDELANAIPIDFIHLGRYEYLLKHFQTNPKPTAKKAAKKHG